MRAREFVKENISSGATGSGSIAVVAQPMMTMLRRTNETQPGKYRNSVVWVDGKKNKNVNKRS